jgi:hypothetical protein
VQQLQQLVQQLTPDNSGLTSQQIATDQAAVDVAVEQIQQAVSDLSQPVVPPTIIQQQQQNVNNTQNQVDNLQQQLNNANNPPVGQGSEQNQNPGQTPPSGTSPDAATNPASPDNSGSSSSDNPLYVPPTINLPGTRYIPQEPVQDPTKPKLIEGANPGL